MYTINVFILLNDWICLHAVLDLVAFRTHLKSMHFHSFLHLLKCFWRYIGEISLVAIIMLIIYTVALRWRFGVVVGRRSRSTCSIRPARLIPGWVTALPVRVTFAPSLYLINYLQVNSAFGAGTMSSGESCGVDRHTSEPSLWIRGLAV